MKTQKNDTEKERINIIKFFTLISSIGIVILLVAIITMTIGVIRFDLRQYASSVTAVYLVVLLSLLIQWTPLWSIHKMLKDMKSEKAKTDS